MILWAHKCAHCCPNLSGVGNLIPVLSCGGYYHGLGNAKSSSNAKWILIKAKHLVLSIPFVHKLYGTIQAWLYFFLDTRIIYIQILWSNRWLTLSNILRSHKDGQSNWILLASWFDENLWWLPCSLQTAVRPLQGAQIAMLQCYKMFCEILHYLSHDSNHSKPKIIIILKKNWFIMQ